MWFIYEDNKNSSSLDLIKHMYAEPFFVHHAVYNKFKYELRGRRGRGEEDRMAGFEEGQEPRFEGPRSQEQEGNVCHIQ